VRAEKDYKTQLRAALSQPGLSAEQRREIQLRLGQIGQPKVYDAKSPPLPGAIPLPVVPESQVEVTVDQIQMMKKADLQDLAKQRGLPSTGTRSDLILRLQ
jgi:hypothetical protein